MQQKQPTPPPSVFTATNPSRQQMTGFPIAASPLRNMLSHHAENEANLQQRTDAPSESIGDPADSLEPRGITSQGEGGWVSGRSTYNKGLTENGCRIGELIVKQKTGLVLVSGGFKFKQQTKGSGQ